MKEKINKTRKYIKSLENNFKITTYDDIDKLDFESFKDVFNSFEDIVVNNVITKESSIILNRLTDCFDKLGQSDNKDYIREVFILKKYDRFFSFTDIEPFVEIIKQKYRKIS